MVAAREPGQSAMPMLSQVAGPQPLAPGLVPLAPEEGKPADAGTKAPAVVPPPSVMAGKITASASNAADAAAAGWLQKDLSKNACHDALPVGMVVRPSAVLGKVTASAPAVATPEGGREDRPAGACTKAPVMMPTPSAMAGQATTSASAAAAASPQKHSSKRECRDLLPVGMVLLPSAMSGKAATSASAAAAAAAVRPQKDSSKHKDHDVLPVGALPVGALPVREPQSLASNAATPPTSVSLVSLGPNTPSTVAGFPMHTPTKQASIWQSPGHHGADVTYVDHCLQDLNNGEIAALCVMLQKRSSRLSEFTLSDLAVGAGNAVTPGDAAAYQQVLTGQSLQAMPQHTSRC
eukprot:TRINITY_DN12243_c0_g1_i2.p1 TRINITY_DN12243_c0_g1~~TRINITY_DN12243_c0_g1_i2.p1  ORF type:complete len:350 (+),score=71.82 TRINITY_DN12243_c0_g1_i2:57-1106(+)